jgi:antitoxin component HigA of HigAB toxin-antitoxin module
MHVKKRNEFSVYRSYKNQLNEFERQVKCEQAYLQRLQQQIAEVVMLYMDEEQIGFNELVRRLDMSPTKVSNIKKSKANLTLASIARLFALLNKEPVFNAK